jgi:spermidine/putrescine transport system ATP-binding protein
MRRDLEGAFINYEIATREGAQLVMHTTNTGDGVGVGAELSVGFQGNGGIILPEGQLARTGRELAA